LALSLFLSFWLKEVYINKSSSITLYLQEICLNATGIAAGALMLIAVQAAVALAMAHLWKRHQNGSSSSGMANGPAILKSTSSDSHDSIISMFNPYHSRR